jgi:hypothetical protein
LRVLSELPIGDCGWAVVDALVKEPRQRAGERGAYAIRETGMGLCHIHGRFAWSPPDNDECMR